MSAHASRPPAYCRQRETDRADRAFVRIAGRTIKLGVYGSPESQQKYAEVIQAWQQSSDSPATIPSTDPSVSELLVGFLDWAEGYYDPREFGHFRAVAKLLRCQAGDVPAREFGPKRLQAIREAMIELGWTRKSINRQVVRVRQIFTWAVGQELIPANNLEALRAVKGLRAGRCQAKESQAVRPVDTETIEATLTELPEVVGDMVQVQLLTGMRPGELVGMRPMDIDRRGEVWVYRPQQHKNAHRGHQRAIALGPRVQTILLRYLARAADTFCFRPCDSEAKRLAENSSRRQTPLNCGNRCGSNRKRTPKKQPGHHYTVHSYRRAIHRAAKRAAVEQWSPHRLRHTAATEIRDQFGLDACQAVLGHKSAKVSEIYGSLNQAKAVAVAAKIG